MFRSLFTRRGGVAIAAAAVGVASLSLAFAGTAGAAPYPDNQGAAQALIGSGSQTTYTAMQQLDNLFNGSPGCDLTASTSDAGLTSGPGEGTINCGTTPIAPGTIGGEQGFNQSADNPYNDYAVEAPPVGSGTGAALLENAGTGSPTQPICTHGPRPSRATPRSTTSSRAPTVSPGRRSPSSTTWPPTRRRSSTSPSRTCRPSGTARSAVPAPSSAAWTGTAWVRQALADRRLPGPVRLGHVLDVAVQPEPPEQGRPRWHQLRRPVRLVGCPTVVRLRPSRRRTTTCSRTRWPPSPVSRTPRTPSTSCPTASSRRPAPARAGKAVWRVRPARRPTPRSARSTGVAASQSSIQGSGGGAGVTFPITRGLYNLYNNSSAAAPSNQATLNFISEDGFLCKASTATEIDPHHGHPLPHGDREHHHGQRVLPARRERHAVRRRCRHA